MSSRDSSSTSSSSGDPTRLPRGSACLNCKRRRVRCDGQRPICGPCARYRGHELDDCEFYEGQPPESQILQERLTGLQMRLAHLSGIRNSDEVDLHSPYESGQSRSERHTGQLRGGSFGSEDIKTLPGSKIHGLVTQFLSFASDVGFFLDHDRFLRSATQPQSIGHHTRPCPSLLYSVCLWCSKFFPNSLQRGCEETWLTLALRFVTEDLSGSHPRRCLHVMQAEVLLSTYFLNSVKFVEGLVHANAAAALAVSTKSNLIRSASVMQKPSGDAVDEGEWVDGFWTTVALSSYWVLVDENQTFTFYDAPQMKIDTPWPINNYRQEKLIPASHKTLDRFLDGSQDDGYSFLALHAKASVLLKKSIENNHRSDPGAAHQYHATHRALEQLMSAFPKLNMSPDMTMTSQHRQWIATTQMLVQAAIIKLHRPKARASSTARQHCVRAAKVIADLTARCPVANPLQIVNPTIGFVWFIAYDTLKAEIRFMNEQRIPEDKRLGDSMGQILKRMEASGTNSPLICSLLRRMKGNK